jgi:hypothetical protein
MADLLEHEHGAEDDAVVEESASRLYFGQVRASR